MEHTNRRTSGPKKPRREKGYGLAILFFAFMSLWGLLSVILPAAESSDIEKRELATMPQLTVDSFFSGSFAKGFDQYYADTFPQREKLVHLAKLFTDVRGIRMDDLKLYDQQPSQSQPDQPSTPQQDNGQSSSDTSGNGQSQPDTPSQPTPDVGEAAQTAGGVIIYSGQAFSMFGGNRTQAQRYAEVINQYAVELPGVQIYNLVVPTAVEFNLHQNYQNLTTAQKPNIDFIYSKLAPTIKAVDAYSAIEAHKDEYLYFRTDHHWTALGAYYAYTAFCETAGITPVPLSSLEHKYREGFLGTLYNQTLDAQLAKQPDTVDYYVYNQPYQASVFQKNAPFAPQAMQSLWGEYASKTNSYSIFLHGDWPHMIIKTGNTTGRKIMVVKESFGNAFVPYLLSHYDEIYVIDQRYFQLAAVEMVSQYGITDLLFINNIFAANTAAQIGYIDRIRNQYYVPTPETSQENTDGASSSDEEEEIS